MAGKFKFKVPFPKKKKVHDSAATSLNIDLPSFEEQELTDIEEIGRGTIGSIFKANKDGKTVVVKRCLAKEPEEKALVLKEARLLSKLKGHENIVKFHGFNHSRSSILIEYVEFTFEFLDIEHSPVHNLRELLRECDSISDFENFEHLNHYVMHDIILGLSFLHKENIVHRDLKPENVLISNQHFVDDGEIAKQWTTKPVIAKLTDFGEARSDLIQTMQVSENTKNINRGTPAYMAPECILHTIQGANQNDLKKMDIWSLGMVAHAMCNPDSRHPYKKEIDDSPVLNKRDVLERLLEKKEKPSSLPKYEDMRRKHWGAIMGVFDLCINFEPNERPNMDEVMRMFVVRCVSIEQLMVSQASISEMLDEAMALGANNVCRDRETLNACTFIALLTSETLLCNRNASMASAAQEVMLNFPKSVNRARSHDQCYSAHEALEVLENCKAMKEVNLEIALASAHTVDVDTAIHELADILNNELERLPDDRTFCGVYICPPYAFLVAKQVGNQLSVMDSHPVPENVGGNNETGAIITSSTSNEVLPLCQWLVERSRGRSPDCAHELVLVSLKDQGDDLDSPVDSPVESEISKSECDDRNQGHITDCGRYSSISGDGQEHLSKKVASSPCGDGGRFQAHKRNRQNDLDPPVEESSSETECDELMSGGLPSLELSKRRRTDDQNQGGSINGRRYSLISESEQCQSSRGTSTSPSPTGDIGRFRQVQNGKTEGSAEINFDRSWPSSVHNTCSSNEEVDGDKSLDVGDTPTPYYHGDKDLPIYKSGKSERFSIMEAVSALQDSTSQRCSKVPLKVRSNQAFLIDTRQLAEPEDVKADMNGSYARLLRAGTWTIKVQSPTDIQVIHRKKEQIPAGTNNEYHLSINSRQNAAGLCRSIFLLRDSEGDVVNNTSLLQYHIAKEVGMSSVDFVVPPHGNRKHGINPYHPTQKSTMNSIQLKLKEGSKSALVYNHASQRGGVMTARHPGEMPRNRQQVYQCQYRLNCKAQAEDDLEYYDQTREQSIVLDHWTKPEDIWVIGTKQMCADLSRFCTSFGSYPLSVDPTFEFGKFEVTRISYRHLFLTSKRSKVPPVFLGPTALHQSKEEQIFARIVSTISLCCPGLKDGIRSFITDGEAALYNALGKAFPNAVGLRCFRHFLSNCVRKLNKIGVRSRKEQTFFLDMVFGKGGVGGLVDSEDRGDLRQKIASVKNAMDVRERLILGKADKLEYTSKFWTYINKNEKTIGEHMVKSVRVKAGVSCRPSTNQSESINNILTRQKEAVVKGEKKGKALTKVDFVKSVWDEINNRQQQELARAICGTSTEYELSQAASHLAVNEDTWFSWTERQRCEYIKRFGELTMEDLKKKKKVNVVELADKQPIAVHSKKFSVDLKEKLQSVVGQDILPLLLQESLILLGKEEAIREMPALETNQYPRKYMVATKATKKGFYVCKVYKDKVSCECTAFKYNSICKHSLCVAEVEGILDRHINTVLKIKPKNPTTLINPPRDAAGKKGGQHKNPWRPRQSASETCNSDQRISQDNQDNVVLQRPFTEVWHNNHPLVVTFVTDEPKAKMCQECGTEFPRGPFKYIPFDMIISHRERWTYRLKGDPTPRKSPKETTKYYCVRSTCIVKRFPYFVAQTCLSLPENVKGRLLPSHVNELKKELNYTVQ